ncbi:MAG: helix-turn-helix domain-containing protein [Sphaerochaeta sp.]|jgi:AraC family L-rhamnose operon transcriptional activator RhaR/AraC family L-rhamnose operon regulatory protein RhaS|uniref:helix-turn-helix domain-containing protein n=1 Tax=Sphaerochaeta sp. TaxID=1972642 RepID=UPI002FC82282
MSRFTLPSAMFFQENRLPLKVLLRDPEIPFSLHSHDFYELVVVVSGTGTHLLSKGNRHLQEGMVFFIKPGTYHGYADIENLVLYNVLIGEQALYRNLTDLSDVAGFQDVFLQPNGEIPLVRLNCHQLSEIIALVGAIKKESQHQDYNNGAGTLAYAKLLQLLILISRFHSSRKSGAFQHDQRLEHIISYMEQNLDRSLSLEELVQYSNMSSSTLNRQFKLSTGWSPVDFHIHRRIAYASTLLLTTSLSIERISEKTGFSDANYFARQFRSHMQMSPRQYKQLWTTPKE